MYTGLSDQAVPSEFQQGGWRDSHALTQLLLALALVMALAVNLIVLLVY